MAIQAAPFNRSPWTELLVFSASILITVLFWIALPEEFQINESTDYLVIYEPAARNIVESRGMTVGDRPLTAVPPGYPILLAGLFGLSSSLETPEEVTLALFILGCMGLSSVLLFVLARKFWGVLPGLIMSLAWMTYPFALWLTKQPNSEIPFLLAFYGGFYLFWDGVNRKRHAYIVLLVSGLLIGMTMLIRPIAIGLGVVLGAATWFIGRDRTIRFRAIACSMLLTGNLIAVLPWQLWLYSKTGRVIPLSTTGSISIIDGLTYAEGYREVTGGVPADVSRLMRDFEDQRDKMQSMSGIVAVMQQQLWERPAAVAKLFLIKAARSWYGTDSRRFESEVLLLQIPYLLLVLWGSRNAWALGGNHKKLAATIWLVTLYFWAMTILVFSMLRYMMPVIGLLFLLMPAVFKRFGSALDTHSWGCAKVSGKPCENQASSVGTSFS